MSKKLVAITFAAIGVGLVAYNCYKKKTSHKKPKENPLKTKLNTIKAAAQIKKAEHTINQKDNVDKLNQFLDDIGLGGLKDILSENKDVLLIGKDFEIPEDIIIEEIDMNPDDTSEASNEDE